jgi:hypothetical protein
MREPPKFRDDPPEPFCPLVRLSRTASMALVCPKGHRLRPIRVPELWRRTDLPRSWQV